MRVWLWWTGTVTLWTTREAPLQDQDRQWESSHLQGAIRSQSETMFKRHTRLGLVINLGSRREVGESCWARTVNATHIATLIGEAGEERWGWMIYMIKTEESCLWTSIMETPWLGFSQPDTEHEAKVHLNVCKRNVLSHLVSKDFFPDSTVMQNIE